MRINKHLPALIGMIAMLSMTVTTGCVSRPSKPIINLGIIENRTNNLLEEVAIRQLPTNALVKTTSILPQQNMELGLPVSKVMADYSVLSWLELGRSYQLKLATPTWQPDEGPRPQTLVFRIYSAGRATISLE